MRTVTLESVTSGDRTALALDYFTSSPGAVYVTVEDGAREKCIALGVKEAEKLAAGLLAFVNYARGRR